MTVENGVYCAWKIEGGIIVFSVTAITEVELYFKIADLLAGHLHDMTNAILKINSNLSTNEFK